MSLAARRRFDHLATELSVALGVAVSRHRLWLAAAHHLESGERAAAFCGEALDGFLACERLAPPPPRARVRLARSVARFDPGRRTPEEIVAGLFAAASD